MGLLSRIFRPSAASPAAEGQYRAGPYTLPVSGGWLPRGSAWNFWQLGQDVQRNADTSAMVEACVSAYAQTIAMCPGSHWITNADGGRERQVNSALTRILRYPNSYQSISDFLLNGSRQLYSTGAMFALAIRNDRFEIKELHLMLGTCSAQVSETGEVFYTLSGNEIIERRIPGPIIVPARDVLHIRLHTPRHHLVGESPIAAAATDLATSNVIGAQQIAFYANMARPSIVLSTDRELTAEQGKAIRERWEENSQGLAAGGVMIAAGGATPVPMHTSAQDSQLAEVMKLSDQHIALAFRVPLQVLGIGGTPFASTEALYQSWLSSGLGFALNHIEEAFGQLFGMKGQPDEYVEFDTSVLLRSNFRERVEAWAAGAKGGIFAANEARADFSLAQVPFGNEPRVQQQDVPLSYWNDQQKLAAAMPKAQPALPDPAPSEPQEDEPDDRSAVDITVRDLLASADECERRVA